MGFDFGVGDLDGLLEEDQNGQKSDCLICPFFLPLLFEHQATKLRQKPEESV